MTVSVSELQERVAAQFSDVQQVDESIIRFTKKSGEIPFAVCYVDITEELPRTIDTLSKYQDRVIGMNYFDGSKSLQWNNYLYFVTSEERLEKNEVRQAKELIEGDRRYARKFVITEDEIESVLNPPVVAHTDITPHANILSIWTERLSEAGLDDAILSDDPIPRRLKLIESSSKKPAYKKTKAPMHKKDAAALPFIHSLQLKKFRDFPLQRSFEFGTVNLIFGINGSGKTSLLEAIELFYCGRNKRNPKAKQNYELVTTLATGSSEVATNRRKLDTLRDRNLAWYGQPEVKTYNLYQSFAQFNFLDTDAAVGLAESALRIDDDLSKLLVGPEASKTWRNIISVGEAVERELRGLRPRETETKEELATLEKRIKDASAVQRESDLICARLEKMIQKLEWSKIQGDKGTFAGLLVEDISELKAIVKQAAALNWIKPPVTFNGLAKYCLEAGTTIEKVEPDITQLENFLKEETRLTDGTIRDREALELTEQARLLIEAGVPEIVSNRNKQQRIVATYSGLIAGFNKSYIKMMSAAYCGMKITACHKIVISELSKAEALLATTKSEYAEFSKLRDQSINLSQELRQIASKILENSPKPDECPLCHTQFEPDELAEHIKLGIDEHLEPLGQKLLTQLRERETAVQDATDINAALVWLKEFIDRAGLAGDISVRSAFAEAKNTNRTIEESQRLIETLNKEIITLESRGISLSRLEKISDRLSELGYPFTELSGEAVKRMNTALKRDLAKSAKAVDDIRKRSDKLKKKLKTNLNSEESSVKTLKDKFSELEERLASTESIQANLSEFLSSFPWPEEKPLAKLAVEADSVCKVATELKVTLAEEKQAKTFYAESIERKDLLEKRLEELKTRIKRFSAAYYTLEKLRKKYSLQSAMESALQQNREGIETIFLRIHSPADFQGLGSNWTTLVREMDDSEANLSEISTGQRAAFALSIFLAQNSQLKKGAPPVVLIDDPIAHIDDLNSLSFLDYLREIALMGRRQIFFSTANSKLATLFVRKFDFLGERGFRRINLSRGEMTGTKRKIGSGLA